MKLKNILRRGGGGSGGEHKASSSSSSKKKASSSSSNTNNTNNNDKNVPDANDIHATNTGSTASHSFDGSGGMVSDVPHGSGIYVDTTRNDNNNTNGGGARATFRFTNDVGVPKMIQTPRKQYKSINSNNKNNNKETTNQRKPPSKSKTSASASLPSLDFAEILQAGYSVLSCVAQCRPMSNATTNADIPTMIDPALNEDNHTVGELTLLTIEREEQRRAMISAAKDRAAEITAGFVGMGITTAASATATAPTTSGHDVSRQTSISRAAPTPPVSTPVINHHQQQQQHRVHANIGSLVSTPVINHHQQQPQHRVHANIGSLLDGNQVNPGDNMQIKAHALLQKANSQNHVVHMQHSVDDSVSFNMPPVNADTVCVSKQAPQGETFIGRGGARPSLSDDNDDGNESSGDENECDSIDGQIGRW